MRTLVLGIGNLILCDEGVGCHAARALQQESLPPDVEVLEAGTAFLDALPALEKADRVIVIDAMHGGEAPGTVYRVPFDDCARPEVLGSLHGFDMSRVLYLTGRTDMPEVVVFGVEPARIDWGMELTAEVAEALPMVIEAVRKEIA